MDDAQINKIRAQIAEFETRLAQGREALRQVNGAISAIHSAPPRREECLASFETALAPLADQGPPILEAWFQRWMAVDPAERERDIAVNLGPMIRALDWKNLILPLLWPVLRAQIANAINAMAWPENALSPAERQQRLKALEPQRIAAEAALNTLESQAAKLGIG